MFPGVLPVVIVSQSRTGVSTAAFAGYDLSYHHAQGTFPSPLFFRARKFHDILFSPPIQDELKTIIDSCFPCLAGVTAQALIRLWDAVRMLGSAALTCDVGLQELEKFYTRVDRLLPSLHDTMDVKSNANTSLSSLLLNSILQEDIYLEARDVFLGTGTLTASACATDNIMILIA
ncbi:hypothetical protein C8J57DRAFT_1504737 [Mycena rebaudengoi]|nr:hypothetical protein C8J57DRAFT_1504737 [Mycena rebaudengoi]